MIASEPLLSVQDLSVEYAGKAGSVRAVDGVSFGVKPGETLGIVGESGCGKTTIALSVLRLLPDNARILGGAIRYERQELLSLKLGQMRKIRWKEISIIFQGAMNSLNPVFRVGDQLVDIVRLHEKVTKEEADQRVASIFEVVGLDPERRHGYPHEFSGGMKQRAVIAMALLLRPKLVIADEPTTALDVVVQAQILEEISSLQEKLGISLVLITHDISIVAQVCDTIAVMYAGRLLECGPTREVFNRPRNPYTLSLLAAYPPLHGPRSPLIGIPGAPPDLAEIQTGCRFAPRCFMARSICSETEPELLPVAASSWSSRCHFISDIPERLNPPVKGDLRA